jgi:hypothetical protein
LALHDHDDSNAVEPVEVVGNEAPPGAMVEAQFVPPLTHPDSKLQGYWSPADSFKGWKQINVRGKLASKSFGDLQVLNLAWNAAPKPPRRRGAYAPGDAPFEKLPIELLSESPPSIYPSIYPSSHSSIQRGRLSLPLPFYLIPSFSLFTTRLFANMA